MTRLPPIAKGIARCIGTTYYEITVIIINNNNSSSSSSIQSSIDLIRLITHKRSCLLAEKHQFRSYRILLRRLKTTATANFKASWHPFTGAQIARNSPLRDLPLFPLIFDISLLIVILCGQDEGSHSPSWVRTSASAMTFVFLNVVGMRLSNRLCYMYCFPIHRGVALFNAPYNRLHGLIPPLTQQLK